MKKTINRQAYRTKIEHFFLKEEKITILLGARRVGKTFLMKQIYEEIQGNKVFLSFDTLQLQKPFTSSAEFLHYIKSLSGYENVEYLFLDEIQLIPGISRILKEIYDTQEFFDTKNKIKILASGSGSFQIFKQIEDSLVGRAKYINIHPLNMTEFLAYKGKDIQSIAKHYNTNTYEELSFLLEEYLKFGGYPEVVINNSIEEKIQIIQTIINSRFDKDIKLLLKADELFSFRQFFKLLAGKTPSIVKTAHLAKELHTSAYNIKKYFIIAKKSYMITSLSLLNTNPISELSLGEKIFFADNGILNYLLGNFQSENRGELIENITANLILRKYTDFVTTRKKKNESEIDIVIKDIMNNTYIPYEIKAGSTDNIPKIFNSFITCYQVKEAYVLNKDIKKERIIKDSPVKVHILPRRLVEIT